MSRQKEWWATRFFAEAERNVHLYDLDLTVLEMMKHIPDFPRGEGKRVLDVGCGGGKYLVFLADRRYQVTGIDFSPSALELTRWQVNRLAVEAELVEHDFTEFPYPFPAASFDVVLGVDAIHHLLPEKFRLAVAEIHRLLKPGGLFIGTFISTLHHSYGDGQALGEKSFERDGIVHTFQDLDDVKLLLQRYELIELVHRHICLDHVLPEPRRTCRAHWVFCARKHDTG
jgi:SAM-dependent methyltransferase